MSDLFTERTQFEMMYLTLTELRRVHPSEDEILIQYLVPATCKAAAVLGMVSEGSAEAAPIEAAWDCTALGPCIGHMFYMHLHSSESCPKPSSLAHVDHSSGQLKDFGAFWCCSHRDWDVVGMARALVSLGTLYVVTVSTSPGQKVW